LKLRALRIRFSLHLGSMRLAMLDDKRGVQVERRCPWCNEVGMSECVMCVPKFARTTGPEAM
jgi:hypothetical protein